MTYVNNYVDIFRTHRLSKSKASASFPAFIVPDVFERLLGSRLNVPIQIHNMGFTIIATLDSQRKWGGVSDFHSLLTSLDSYLNSTAQKNKVLNI